MTLNFYDSALRRRLSASARDVGKIVHMLKNRDPSNDNQDSLESIVERHARRTVAIRQRIDAEAKQANGITLTLLKAEFERDLNGILGELLAWQERLDARARGGKSH